MSMWKLFFSAKFTCNVSFIHVVEWADVIKFECWIFSCTFGIILYLGHVSCVQHRFELSGSWCMFLLSVLAWNSSDCLESFSPLTEGVITTRRNRMKFRLLSSSILFRSSPSTTKLKNAFFVHFSFVLCQEGKTNMVCKILHDEQIKVLYYCLLILKIWC